MYSSALLSSEKWNRSILTGSNIFVKASYQLSEMNTSFFVDDFFDEKWEEKVIFLCIIHCEYK